MSSNAVARAKSHSRVMLDEDAAAIIADLLSMVIDERAKNNMCHRDEYFRCQAWEAHNEAGMPACVCCDETENYLDCPMITWFREQAEKELLDEKCDEIDADVTNCMTMHIVGGSTPTNMMYEVLSRYSGDEKNYASYQIGFLMGYMKCKGEQHETQI